VTVSVPADLVARGMPFSFELPASALPSDGQPQNVTITTAEGRPIPGWLRFVPESRSFVASAVPRGGLPIRLRIASASTQVEITIAERP